MIIVRPAVAADADAAIDVVRRSIQSLCAADHRNDEETLSTWLSNKTAENFLAWLTKADQYCVVAAAPERLVGIGFLHRRGEILLLYVAPGAQRHGAGRRIHAALEAQALRWRLPSLHLDSTALARPFYEALGYRASGPAMNRFGVLTCYPYRKPLPPAEAADAIACSNSD